MLVYLGGKLQHRDTWQFRYEDALVKNDSLQRVVDELKKEIEQLRGEQDPLAKGIQDNLLKMWEQIVIDITVQNIKLKEELDDLKQKRQLPQKVSIPACIKFSIAKCNGGTKDLQGPVRGDYAIMSYGKMWTMGHYAIGTTTVELEFCTLEDLAPGDIFFDDELLTERLADIENYGIILDDMSVAFWCGKGVIVEPEPKTVSGQYYKVVVKN
jgi:hypothetical protein